MEGVAVTQTRVLLISSHVSVQVDNHQAILEYRNGDGKQINYNATVYFFS
jgi:hypothetical protein